MALCQKRNRKYLFGLISLPDKHLYVISNVFYTLNDSNLVDVIKTCEFCSAKEALCVDRKTLIETSLLFPAAFKPLVREYIQSWEKTI